MRLIRVNISHMNARYHTLLCCKCNKFTPASSTYADLDGEAFKSYYCGPCAQIAQHDADVAAQDAANDL